jgi:Na+-transporting NADH:ubiquinone oxidoreductase subunit F
MVLLSFIPLIGSFFGIDLALIIYAILAFVVIGVSLTSIILFTKAKLVSTEACKISINGNPKLTKHVEGGGTLLVALTSNGIPIPCPCGGKATCKQCKV